MAFFEGSGSYNGTPRLVIKTVALLNVNFSFSVKTALKTPLIRVLSISAEAVPGKGKQTRFQFRCSTPSHLLSISVRKDRDDPGEK